MNAFTIAKRIITQIKHDKRSLALLFIAPMFVLFLLNVILNSPEYTPKIAVYNCSEEYVKILEKNAEVTQITDMELSIDHLNKNKIDAIVQDDGLITTLEGTDTSTTMIVKKAVNLSVAELTKNRMSLIRDKLDIIDNKQLSELLSNVPIAKIINEAFKGSDINYIYLHGSDEFTYFDAFAPVLMGFFIFFFVFLLAGVAFLRERISGTLERLFATPIKRIEIVMGYFLGFGVFVILQTLIIQIFGIFVLKIEIHGSFILLLFINLLLAACSLSLGTLLSAFAKNEFQLFQFIPLVIVPQILLSGVFSLNSTPSWIHFLSKLFPLTYAAEALTAVVIRGNGVSDIIPELSVLLAFSIIFIILNTIALKKYRAL